MWVAEIGLVVVVCCNCGFWIAYLGFEISNFVYCVLGLGLLRVRFLGFSFFWVFWSCWLLFFFFFAGVLVELKAAVIVVMVWLCRDDDCGLVVP